MKKIIALLLLLLFLPSVAFADYILAAGATSQMIDIFVKDSSVTTGAGLTGLAYNSSGIVCYYHRSGDSSATSVTLASSTLGTYTSGAFKEVSSANMPGTYQFGIPNAAIAAGATYVVFECKGVTNMTQTSFMIRLSPQVAIQSAGITGASFGYDGALVSESGTSLTLATGAVDSDNQFSNGFVIIFYDAGGLVEAKSCIRSSTASSDVVVTQEDITALTTVGDSYVIAPDSGCNSYIATNGIVAASVGQTGAEKIADYTLRRTTANIEASSDGDAISRKSLYGSIAKQTHKAEHTGGLLKTYKSDGSTVLSSQATTTSSTASPIVSIGN